MALQFHEEEFFLSYYEKKINHELGHERIIDPSGRDT